MVQAVQVAVPSGGLPPLPQGAANVSERPSGANMSPGFVAPPPDSFSAPAPAQSAVPVVPTGITPEDYAAFLAFKAQKAAPVAPAADAPVALVPAAALDLSVSAAQHDPILGSMFSVFDNVAKGIDRGRAIGNALVHGNVELVDKAYLREIGGENAENLIKMASGIVTHCNALVEQAEASVFAIAGGETNWTASSAAFSKGAPDHLKQYVASAMNSGSKTQIDAAATHVVEWAKASGLVATPATGFVQAGGGAPGATQALSRVDFQKLHYALDKTDRNYESLKGELYGRRAIGKQLGI